jgi:hypothetical protein
MKYSNYIGVFIAVALIVVCFIPWVYIEAIPTTITGINADKTNFGRPGLMNIVLSTLAIILFILPKIWAKRTNIFVGSINLAWSMRNFLIVTQCELGDCPQKQLGIYLLPVLATALLLMTFIPPDPLKK